ncbi:sensor domain-containing phosphodiesterase [Rhodanobacter sp. DHB23]|uniref:putative bifunctional diguanylate cyclase/phosphodiesterase n=1 Tax=Rhodanobacter sp. DHB23 TaxID=2775923 RepID=UPI0017807467|nr:sensor domain-containing phosphodiesterase [Rhodanobacter sp. DHB23]MBD8871280.1 GGDEF and EAL domain-containing protein [Rhodanobacter sp. DHB23]
MEISRGLPSVGQTDADHAPPGGAAAEQHALPGFEAVARLATHALGVPLVALLLGDGSTFWYTPPGQSGTLALDDTLLAACRRIAHHGVAEIVADAREDARFLAPGTDPAHATVGFFACEPVFGLDGQRLGVLFVVDRRPRLALANGEQAALRDAAALAGTGAALRSYLNRIDPSTRLPHRYAFFADLAAQLAHGVGTAWLTAIEIAPVARFNAFVRAMGHTYADALVRATAERVQAWTTPGMQLYMVAPTRLAVLLPGAHGAPSPARLDALVAALREPVDCLGITLSLQPGVGLLEVEAHELRGGDPLRRVMNASWIAMGTPSGWTVYNRSDDERQRQEFFLVTELAAALSDGTELELHYQPRVALENNRCVALEALARWRHPTLGPVSPGTFVPLAEQAGLIRGLTDWVFDHGLAQLAAWQREGLDVRLSLNVSSIDLDATLESRLAAAARRHGVPLNRLELEFTEGTAIYHNELTRNALVALREAGVGIAIDDFGIGYSNLDALRRMPASSLKIDQSLVRGLGNRRHDAAIVRAMVALGHELGFRVVMEGVETASVLAAVRDMECDEVQGYHIAMPMPAAEVAGWLRGQAARDGASC